MGDQLMIPMPSQEDMGPAMKALTEKQRKFIVAFFYTGNRNKAAYIAGYTGEPGDGTNRVQAWQVWHNPKVITALKEFGSQGVLGGLVPAALHALEEIVSDPHHKQRAKAVEMILDRTGMHAKTETIHTEPEANRTERILRIMKMAKAAGMDPKKLIGGATDFVDADFVVVDKQREKEQVDLTGLEDIL